MSTPYGAAEGIDISTVLSADLRLKCWSTKMAASFMGFDPPVISSSSEGT